MVHHLRHTELLPLHALFISESPQGEEEAEDIDESNGSARYFLLVSPRNDCAIAGVIFAKCMEQPGLVGGGRGGIRGFLEVSKPFWGFSLLGDLCFQDWCSQTGFLQLFCCSSPSQKGGGALLVEQGCVQQGSGCGGVVCPQKIGETHRKREE